MDRVLSNLTRQERFYFSIEVHGVAHVIVIIWIKPSSFLKDNSIEIQEFCAM